MPISDCEVRDPRIRRTRQLIQGALQTLLISKSFDDISVSDITDLATINRATFYDHYTDKFALLDALVAGGFHLLLHERNVIFDGTCPSAAAAIILATCDYLGRLHAGRACDKQSAFDPLMDAAITAAICKVMIKGMQNGLARSGSHPGIQASAVSWAIYGAVKEWSRTPNSVPAEEIVPVILKLILPMLPRSGAADAAFAESISMHPVDASA